MSQPPAGVEEWGWAGSVRQLLQLHPPAWLSALEAHYRRLCREEPSESQKAAWTEEFSVLSGTLRMVCVAQPEAVDWGIIFEYELPLEGGRRPDVVILAGQSILVLEFKSGTRIGTSAVDQVAAYARDISEYHEQSHGLPIQPLLVATKSSVNLARGRGVEVTNISTLGSLLEKFSRPGQINLEAWLNSDYKPLPFLVEAARRIFAHEPLPHVRRALSAGIPEAVDALGKIAEEAAAKGDRALILLAGVPGSGKTLAGLRLVYERSRGLGSATFLSGNAPLVAVLRDALRSNSFVKDLHAYIQTYGIGRRIPKEHVIVFDEAQRAWDAEYMSFKKGIEKSEPQLLIEIGEKVDEWVAMVGLIGDGQEIHTGEERGIPEWVAAVRKPPAVKEWSVHCPPRLASDFAEHGPRIHRELDLTYTLRSRRADDLHAWVRHLLDGSAVSIATAARLAPRIHDGGFPLYVTRDLEDARRYARERYDGIEVARYGLLCSSQARNLARYGLDNSFQATARNFPVARWYNDPPSAASSCCALSTVATEFSCQGLELDLPIICWGDDLLWSGSGWKLRPKGHRPKQRDPENLLRNSYRVLLTRGRDGLVVFLPREERLDTTEMALLAAGVRPLLLDVPIAEVA